MSLFLRTAFLNGYLKEQELEDIWQQVEAAHTALHQKTGLGSDAVGWVSLPNTPNVQELADIKQAAANIQADTDVLVVIGIGGSYLGAKAAIDLLCGPLYNSLPKQTPDIYFVGNSLSPDYLNDILALCEGKRISLNVISKSGTTTEPALAFRVFKELMESRYGKEQAAQRIYCTTDKEKGTLKELADREGYKTFVIPDDIGGRYSVLTAVGLLPMAVAGIKIDSVLQGAKDSMDAYSDCRRQNDCYRYAAIRNLLYQKGKTTELFACYEPRFMMMNEWLKQLFGESEGKDGKGIFPASAIFSTDLHSMGQYIQDGMRNLFETVIAIKTPQKDFYIRKDQENLDGLNFLAGQEMSQINEKAMEGTMLAHHSGGVPGIVIELPQLDDYTYGWLVYFFEKACGISGYILGVNPFNQPGVEDYKKNMFALLGKQGYEQHREQLLKAMNQGSMSQDIK